MTEHGVETLKNIEHRIAISKDYGTLQGYLLIPHAIWFLLAPLMPYYAPILPFLALGSMIAITYWYENKFGKVISKEFFSKETLLFSVTMVVMIAIGNAIDHFSPGPILWTPLLAGPLMLILYRTGLRNVGLTFAHWASCISLTLCAFIPFTPWHPNGYESLAFVGVPLIIIGIIDHRRLEQGLKKETTNE